MPRKSLLPGISCHSFNGDMSKCVVSPGTHELHVYATNGSEDFGAWKLEYVLSEHAGYVSSVDWNATTDAIVSCGHDRNAYVWTFKEGKWAPTLVIARLTRAATCVRWDASGSKFAVASASKQVAVCYYEPSNDWYIAKSVKKHKSTVTSLAFSPCGAVLATGSTDAKARLFSAYVKGVDSADASDLAGVFDKVHKFGELLFEAHAGSWVNAVAFSPDGRTAAYATHGSTLLFASFQAGAEPAVQTLVMPTLPYTAIEFADASTLVGAGFGNIPVVIRCEGGVWKHASDLDAQEDKKEEKKSSKFGAARAMFAASASKGVAINNAAGGAGVTETKLGSRHQNTILSLNIRGGTVTTAGVDGCVYYWRL